MLAIYMNINTTQISLAATKKQAKKDLRQGILCTICAVVCLIFAKYMWIFALIFALCASFYFYHNHKLKKNTQKIETMLEEFEDEDHLAPYRHNATLSKKERKQQYHQYLEEIEQEFNIDDIDEDEDDT